MSNTIILRIHQLQYNISINQKYIRLNWYKLFACMDEVFFFFFFLDFTLFKVLHKSVFLVI